MRFRRMEKIVLRTIGDVYLLIPVGKSEYYDITSFLILNETGSFIWNYISEARTADEIAMELIKAYHLQNDMILDVKNDVLELLYTLLKLHFCVEEEAHEL